MNPDLLGALIEQAPDALVFCDAAGIIQVWNAAAEALFGHPAAAALGASLDLIIPESLRGAHWAGFHHAMDSGITKYGGQVLTTRAAHPAGERLFVDLSFAHIRDTEGAIIGVLASARRNSSRAAPPASPPSVSASSRCPASTPASPAGRAATLPATVSWETMRPPTGPAA